MGDDAQVLLCEPRRMRDRAADLLAEEADLAATLAVTWGATEDRSADHGFPRLHLEFDRLLAHTKASAWHLVSVPDSPDTPQVQGSAWDPVVGDGTGLMARLVTLQQDGYRIVVGADGEGSAARLRDLLVSEGVSAEVHVAPLERGAVLRGVKLALLAESDLTGRRRAHRKARPRRRDAEGFFDDLKKGDYVVHHQHGVARYGGMVKRAIGGVDRDYLLLEYKGDDKLYVPSDQIDAVRHYTGGDSPSLSRLGGDGWQRTKAKVRAAVAEIAQELVVLYQKRLQEGGTAFPPDTPWQKEFEDGFPFQETPDQLKAIADVKDDMEEPTPMDRLVCGDVGLRQDRGGHPGRVQGGAGRQAGGGARAHHAAGPAALPDLQRALRRLPGAGRGAVALPHPRPGPEGGARASRPARSTSSSAPTGCCRATSRSRTSACSWSTRSSASASATRSRSSSSRPASTC